MSSYTAKNLYNIFQIEIVINTLTPSNDYRVPGDSYILNNMKVCAAITLVLVANTAYIGVEAWGGLFNRFSPEMLSNLGYGSHGGYINRPGLLQVFRKAYLSCKNLPRVISVLHFNNTRVKSFKCSVKSFKRSLFII